MPFLQIIEGTGLEIWMFDNLGLPAKQSAITLLLGKSLIDVLDWEFMRLTLFVQVLAPYRHDIFSWYFVHGVLRVSSCIL